MRCRRCDYRLWNLKSRQCPECAEPFKPSDYEFRINSVQFCCPHCEQAYYGTDDKGHLVPVEFDCASCGQHIHMDDMLLLPTRGIEEEQTAQDVMPWLARKERGLLRSWCSTIGMALIRPQKLIRLVPHDSSVASAMWFAILTLTLVSIVGMGALFAIGLTFALLTSGTPGGTGRSAGLPAQGTGTAALALGSGLGGALIFVVVVWALYILLFGLVVHALLRITGRTRHGLGRTYHALGYSAGANVLLGIPCFGFYFGWIWGLVSAVLMIKEGQQVHGARAAFAVLTLPVTLFVGFVVCYIWMITSFMASSMPFPGATSGPTSTILTGLLDYTMEHNDALPPHALTLASGNYFTSFDLVATGSNTEEADVPIAGSNLERFSMLEPGAQADLLRKVVDGLPSNVVAHRLGDFVFTYHGMDLETADPQLWMVIMSPAPEVNPLPSISGMVAVGLVSGESKILLHQAFLTQLAEQNRLRALTGLPPLPDPRTITHTRPAVAGPEKNAAEEEEPAGEPSEDEQAPDNP